MYLGFQSVVRNKAQINFLPDAGLFQPLPWSELIEWLLVYVYSRGKKIKNAVKSGQSLTTERLVVLRKFCAF